MAKRSPGTESGRLKRGEKGAAIMETVLRNPGAGNKAVAEMVQARGIPCSAQDVANVKNRMRRGQRGRFKELSAHDLRKVKELAHQAGGMTKLSESIDSVERMATQVGGLDRLKQGIRALTELTQK